MKKRYALISAVLTAVLLTVSFAGELKEFLMAKKGTVTVDFENTVGEIRELNGINNGPKSGYTANGVSDQWKIDAVEIYRSLGIPFVRMHDSEYPYGQDKFVDIHCIFPDFSRNPDDPDAYDFTYTDKYIEAIRETGAQILFRLGESIDHSGNNLYINPPENYEKWAQICEHIIRHYNKGWADGFSYGITYWEIWNEPDNSKMWTGKMEEYFELYKITARYLKECHPDIKIGGYAAGECSEENISKFLQYINEDGIQTALDFFSWHTYTSDPEIYSRNAYIIRQVLDKYGYEDTISILDEWNYVEDWKDLTSTYELNHSFRSAAYLTASLITMQNSPVDMAAYYDGQFVQPESNWCGLYQENGKLLPGYYAFDFYGRLFEQKNQANVQKDIDNLYVCAASEEKRAVLLANYSTVNEQVVWIRLKTEKVEKAVITRINRENPTGISREVNWSFIKSILKVSPGETVYIEFTE